MFLKSLTLKGFKSFAEATTLEFEPGVTVVVGPNGSGKSNLVDAVAWVLGAQGPRSLRGGKMEDVIFAGTSSRPALGRCEVSLTIDNTAGLLPIELAEVTITRTLFRSGDSEYAINGAPCRLLDIQELLSDSGVGRQQHVIVGQGQLDSVLNSRPEDRRLIIEEAAGVLKYRRRRERAQRRLESTETNLTRLSDLLREVRRQLRPLERQAEAARRYGDLAEEVRALRLHVAGREVALLETRLGSADETRRDLAEQERSLRSRLSALDTDVLAAERTVSASAADGGLADALGHLESTRQRARGLAALLAERRRSLDRDLAASRDEGVVASLESDAARLGAQLAEVEASAQALLADAAAVDEAERRVDGARARFAAEWGERAGVLEGGQPEGDGAPAGLGELRAALSGHRNAAARDRSEADRLRSRRDVLEDRAARLGDETGRLRAELEELESAAFDLARRAQDDSAARLAAEAEAESADAHHRDADREAHAWQARSDALAQALTEAAARAGVERLAGCAGVVGTLLDLVEIDPGWEAAFEAAAGDALAAVVVDGPDAARTALDRLHELEASGAVLVLGLDLPAAAGPGPAESVRAHVRSADPRVERLLDALLGGIAGVAGGWRDAAELACAHPGLVVVSRAGDRLGPSGWRTGASGVGATRAAVDDAERRRDRTVAAAEEARGRLEGARTAAAEAAAADTAAAHAVAGNASQRARAGDRLDGLQAEAAAVREELAAVVGQLNEVEERVEGEDAQIRDLESLLPDAEAREASRADEAAAMRSAREEVERLAGAARALRAEMEVRAAAIEERRSLLSGRLTEVEDRLRSHVAERQRAAERRVRLESALVAVARLGALVESRSQMLDEVLVDLRERRRVQAESTRAAAVHLDSLRSDRSDNERALERVREHAQRASLEEAESRMRLETLVESLRRELDCEPDTAKAAPCPPIPEGTTASARLRDLERELRLLGPINPLALEEFSALEERHQFLQGQLDDVKSSRRELSKVIRAIDTEIIEVFAAAYADVADNFEKLFSTLFPGGAGRLRLTDADNLLDTGVEIEGRPSGKNVKRMSLLSGGERSLTAIAFLFSVFRSRPSPFYLLDEVEAALDDVNLHRFLDLVHDFRDEAQLLIVSHQKRTMEAADCLYGVTMQPGGSSKVVSERVTTPV
jgi:chromosome segregation protein